MTINFVKHIKIYYIFSGILILASIFAIFSFGLKPGIDFTGGTILELEYETERPSNSLIRENLKDFNLGEFFVQPTGEKGVILKMETISEQSHQEIVKKLSENNKINELRFESIGPTIGKELKEKTKIVTIFSLVAIVLYIAFAFRKVSFPAKSWQYGIVSLFILSHDILIILGVFSILGKVYGTQITIPVVTALLTVVGYAINNVVVVYDRLRENLLKVKSRQGEFQDLVNNSTNQTLSRQINTSLTTLFPLLFIFFLGGETLKYFALILGLGIIIGTYSSIFLACPIIVTWLRWAKRI